MDMTAAFRTNSLQPLPTIDTPMKFQRTSHLAAAALIAWLSLSGNSIAAASETGGAAANASSQDALDAASERIRQTGAQIKADIAAMREARRQRAALEARQEAERRKEAERAREQSQKDAAQLAAAKEAKQRQSIEAQLAQARREAEERAAKAERERLAAIQAQRALEEKLAKEVAAKQKVLKESGDNKLGQEIDFGVDI
jgi:ATPase subunit of ABC transporter with duplicated ATPase domains